MNKDFTKLEEKIQIYFDNKDLLTQAFIHRSYLNENPNIGLQHNERLEFLGDAVLELSVTEYLYNKYENPEGELTSWRAALVNSKMLSKVAQELDFNKFILLSRGEAKDTGRARQFILANAMEALIGAIYLDKGYKLANQFIVKNIVKELPKVLEKKLYRDPKSTFQEQSQDKVGVTPTYDVLEESGPDHDRHFVVGVYLEEELVAEGGGSSKQEAQEEAAQKALEVKGW
ncbi:MAG: ribonuclease III [Candidatus Spechtbacteria bacterium RIFCSPLOWO2_02_FULL_38_8]|uniref:Ribonuclease 3 n=1 Tax=Candidatus Spechtbacteria bacterium RIFCSPLOWO2_02_FULL_38_8 TaxID=1802164 RepID=A0A1G2HKI7_9BACT|nr:MAG: ribonuclease III [Candidatus Spechtbacteria bacterium RIFCSPLOWO2_02_FULL_38_8]